MTPFVCKAPDDFVRDKDETYWTVRLSNGEHVVQDDDRPGVEPHSAWLRLARYVKQNKLRIEAMWVQFRSHVEHPLPENAGGYFFCKCSMGFLFEGETFGVYILGYLCDGIVRVQKWKVPELLLLEQENRDPDDKQKVGQFLIRNVYGEAGH